MTMLLVYVLVIICFFSFSSTDQNELTVHQCTRLCQQQPHNLMSTIFLITSFLLCSSPCLAHRSLRSNTLCSQVAQECPRVYHLGLSKQIVPCLYSDTTISMAHFAELFLVIKWFYTISRLLYNERPQDASVQVCSSNSPISPVN